MFNKVTPFAFFPRLSMTARHSSSLIDRRRRGVCLHAGGGANVWMSGHFGAKWEV